MKFLQTLSTCSASLLSIVSLRADVIVTLDLPEQQIAPGMTAHYTGRIENTGSNAVFLSATTFSLYGNWLGLDADDTAFYVGVPTSLTAGQSWTGELFLVKATVSATNGLFFGSLAIYGGIDDAADDQIGEPLEFRVSVVIPPDPMVLEVPIMTGDAVTLLWTGAPGIRLQTSPSLISPVWADVPNTDGEGGADVPLTGAPMFFRLIRQ